jgi:hypothetical protein
VRSAPDRAGPQLTRIAADVYDPDSIKAALRDRQVVLPGLGTVALPLDR